MTPLSITPTTELPKVILTNGIGEPVTSHLNFSRSLADAQNNDATIFAMHRAERESRQTGRRRSYAQRAKIGYAGREAGEW